MVKQDEASDFESFYPEYHEIASSWRVLGSLLKRISASVTLSSVRSPLEILASCRRTAACRQIGATIWSTLEYSVIESRI